MPSAIFTITDFAERLILSGADRIKHRFDGRRLAVFRRKGLLAYPDGTYGLSTLAMFDAIKMWESVARDPYVSDKRRKELLGWSARGRLFIAHHETIAAKRFSDLSASRYAALWELVVSSTRQEVFHGPEMTQGDKALWGALEKRGYVMQERRGQPVVVHPTSAGNQLVVVTGNPYFA